MYKMMKIYVFFETQKMLHLPFANQKNVQKNTSFLTFFSKNVEKTIKIPLGELEKSAKNASATNRPPSRNRVQYLTKE